MTNANATLIHHGTGDPIGRAFVAASVAMPDWLTTRVRIDLDRDRPLTPEPVADVEVAGKPVRTRKAKRTKETAA